MARNVKRHRIISYPQLLGPENMDAVIKYGTIRYEYLGRFLMRILPKVDAEILVQLNSLEVTEDNIVALARFLQEQMRTEYQEVQKKDQEEYRNGAHQSLRGIFEITQQLGMPREMHVEIDLPIFPGETQKDLGVFFGTFQTMREVGNNSAAREEKFLESCKIRDEDLNRHVTI
jgi:hypothetical protein